MNARRGRLHPIAALRRRVAILSSVPGACLLLAYWIAMGLPNYYEASTTIFFEPEGGEQALLRSDVASSALGQRPLTSRNLSRSRLSRIVDDLGLVERDALAISRQEVVAAMRSRIQIVAVERGIRAAVPRDAPAPDTFRIAFRDRDPEVAARVAQRLAEELVREQIDEHLRATRDKLAWIESEQTRLDGEYRLRQLQVEAFKAENAGRLPEDLARNRRARSDIVGQLRRAQRRGDSARSEEAFWDDQVFAARAGDDPGAEGAEAGGSVALRRAETRRAQAAREAVNRVRDAERLKAAAAAIELRLAESPEVAGKLGALTEGARKTREALAELAEQKLEAELQVEVERRRLAEQFRILEAALLPRTPSSPHRLLIIVLGGIVGLLGGIGAAVAAELRDHSFRVARDMQSVFGIPVLAAIPDILLPADLDARRRRRLRTALAASFGVAFCVTGGALTYVYVNGAPGWLTAAAPRLDVGLGTSEGRSEELGESGGRA